MRWQLGRRSQNIEDRRGGGGGLPGGMRIPIGGRSVGGGLGILAIALIAMLFGVDPSFLLSGLSEGPMAPADQPAPQSGAPDDQAGAFVAAVLGETEAVWQQRFAAAGRRYEEPQLVLFNGAVQSACGYASAAAGPFYCPGDRKVYLDTSFFDELHARFGAEGDFARAYVIAHEIGHHVQNLLGIADQVNQARSQASEVQGNQLSVMLELQADCFAGVWANALAKQGQLLEQGDLEEALGAANAIGGDRLQRQAQGYVVPDSFTHGSAEQRMRWFTIGAQTGSMDACDTFNSNRL